MSTERSPEKGNKIKNHKKKIDGNRNSLELFIILKLKNHSAIVKRTSFWSLYHLTF